MTEAWEEAKAELQTAIKAFYHRTDPDAYIGDWVLIAHKDKTELMLEGKSAISTVAPTGQSFYRTTGLVEEARKIL